MLNIWILWWNAQAVPFTHAWWSAPFFWPVPDAMALSEHLAGLSLVATPLQIAGAGPVTAYNLCLLLTYALSALCAFLLVRRLTGSTAGAACAGLAFACSPYRAGQLAHLQVLSAQWMPLALLALHAYVDSGAPRWLLVFGTAWLLLALSNGYYLLFFPVLLVVWLAWFVDWRRRPRRGLTIVAAWAIASLPLLPILWRYSTVHHALGLTRPLSDVRQFSATPASFLQSPPLLALWPTGMPGTGEQYLFPGVTVLVLAIVGLTLAFTRRGSERGTAARSPMLFYVAAAVLMFAFALGPGGQGDVGSPLRPYTWLLALPGFESVRVAARFAMLGSLCLAIAAGLTVASLPASWGRWRPIVGAIAMAGVLADGLTAPMPLVAPPPRIEILGPADAAVIELPPDNPAVTLAAMFRAMGHRHPLVNGYSGHAPPASQILSVSLRRDDPSALLALARARPLVIVVNESADPDGGFRALVEALPGIESHGVSRAGAVFLLPAQPRVPAPTLDAALAAEAHAAGGYRLDFDLGTPHTVTAVTFALRRRYEDLADRLRVDVSDDGQTWREVWSGWTGGLALDAALADPLTVPVRIPLPGVKTRFVRLYPASRWMTQEVAIAGR